jgi:hypothetical protein
MTVINLQDFRLRRLLDRARRALVHDRLPSYQFPYVVRRFLPGLLVYQIVLFDDVCDGDTVLQLQYLARRDGMQVCLVLNEEQALYFEPDEALSTRLLPPPRGGVWLDPADWREKPRV